MQFVSLTPIVGATDETKSLEITVDTILSTCGEDIDSIILVRPGNASDECKLKISELMNKYGSKVREIVQTEPGIGGAVRDSVKESASSHIMPFPGDLAIDVDCVKAMIDKAKIYPDSYVKSSRWLIKGSFTGYPFFRREFNRAAQVFLRILFHSKVTDLTNPVGTMPVAMFNSIEWKEQHFLFLPEMVLVPVRLGIDIIEVPTKCTARRLEGKSKNSFIKTAMYLKVAFRVRFTHKNKLLKNDSKNT